MHSPRTGGKSRWGFTQTLREQPWFQLQWTLWSPVGCGDPFLWALVLQYPMFPNSSAQGQLQSESDGLLIPAPSALCSGRPASLVRFVDQLCPLVSLELHNTLRQHVPCRGCQCCAVCSAASSEPNISACSCEDNSIVVAAPTQAKPIGCQNTSDRDVHSQLRSLEQRKSAGKNFDGPLVGCWHRDVQVTEFCVASDQRARLTANAG